MKTSIDNKHLKVAVLIRHFNSAGGGAERYCVELTKKLAEIHEVHVFTQHNHESLPEITFHQIPQWLKRPRYINQLLFSYLTRRATQGKFDIVHSHDALTHANIYTLHVPCFKTKWTQAKGVKKILRWFNTLLSPRKMAYLWLEHKQMQPLANRHFVSVSEYLSRNILENYPQLESNITIAHPGINMPLYNAEKRQILRQEFREKYHIPQHAFVLLFVAHGFKRKGLPAIIQALEVLNQPDIHLIVAGSGNPKEIKISSPMVQGNTHFIGIVRNMDELYPVADAMIHPTLGDTYGMAPLEAMSHHLPVIISSKKYCGFSEHLNNTSAIILNHPNDVEEISKNINLIANQPDLCQTIAKNGFCQSEKINWNTTLNQTLKAYKKI